MDLKFSETVKLLSELFNKRCKCLNIFKDDQQDYLTFAATVNKLCNDFKLADLTTDDFKCLIFAQGLVSAEDAEIRRPVLTKLQIPSRQTVYTTDGSQNPVVDFRFKKRSTGLHRQQTSMLGTILLNYNFQIEYLSFKNICHADGLSRLVPKNTEIFEESIITILRTNCEIMNMIMDTTRELPVTLADIKREALICVTTKQATLPL